MTVETEYAVDVCALLGAADSCGGGPAFAFDGAQTGTDGLQGVILPREGRERARALLAGGTPRVLLGEAALRDSTIVPALAAEFGTDRVGVYCPAQRMQVSWVMDTVSNADFRTMRPSVCEPCWEILKADGTPTGTLLGWWLGQMFERGAGLALVRADIADDADLNICAGLVEQCGPRLWLGPRQGSAPNLADWVRYGQARQLVLPAALYESHPDILAWRGFAAMEAA